MSGLVRVLIVDDHRMLREGLRDRLNHEDDIEVVGDVGTAEEALLLVRQLEPTVVVLDIRLPGMSGINAVRALRKDQPELKILLLTGFDFDQYVGAAIRAGVDGYMLKDAAQSELVDAVRQVAAGGAILPPKIASKVLKNYRTEIKSRGRFELTSREMEVLDLLRVGLVNAAISSRLGVSPRTVESHVSSIIDKLGASSRAEAVRIAIESKLI